jgi:hypothetical protein
LGTLRGSPLATRPATSYALLTVTVVAFFIASYVGLASRRRRDFQQLRTLDGKKSTHRITHAHDQQHFSSAPLARFTTVDETVFLTHA